MRDTGRPPSGSIVQPGQSGLKGAPGPEGSFVSLDGEEAYRIAGCDRMPPFLMNIACDEDLWMFVTSRGGLTAGRKDADGALFPYETVDRLHDAHRHAGPVTRVRVRHADGCVLWSPFADDDGTTAERNLYKNTVGNRITFEEIRHDLGLAFRYRWTSSDALGFVRTAWLENVGSAPVRVELLDGLRNVLPWGAPLAMFQQTSSLVDAYRRTDLDARTGLGIFSLTAKIVDRAEAAEVLRANVVWCRGLPRADVLLAGGAVAAFRRGDPLPTDDVLTGQRGNYLVRADLALPPCRAERWHLVADIGRSHVQIADLRARLLAAADPSVWIEGSTAAATDRLVRNVAGADGLQRTGSRVADAHHFANVLFNNMRGGVFSEGYDLPTADFAAFLETRNRRVQGTHAAWLESLPQTMRAPDLVRAADTVEDPDLARLAREYLPLWFGRRHGDPSRPWNRFHIHVRNPDGSRALHYEGNWRDIFQNWEALGTSFPEFLPSLVAKFVNASTADGFNPYRITQDGVDWEVPDPDDPWSHIGYWGDHQVVYLLRLLEALTRFSPGALGFLLDRAIFSTAEVPYRILPYERLLDDPRETITFDAELAARIDARVRVLGTDGKLLRAEDGAVRHTTLLEKLLIPALSKISNLVPDGGIWMNTQRPEWNDANNALVGSGLSMVTLAYLRRYVAMLDALVAARGASAAFVSARVAQWLGGLRTTLRVHRGALDSAVLPDEARKRILDELGAVFCRYRTALYTSGLGGEVRLDPGEIRGLCRDALAFLDHALDANRRPDGLFHSYNLLALSADGASAAVHRLPEMLEGQVAVLASGFVEPADAVELLDRLFESRLFREDVRSFLLYPERELPAFLDKNVVPDDEIARVPLLAALLEAGVTSLVERDAGGVCRFHGDFTNADDVAAALERLGEAVRWSNAVDRDRDAVLDVFERVFRHRSFTGRSGRMYGYEGLGCVYWHMVAKLLLAVQETALRAARNGAPEPIVQELVRAYYRVRSGLGFEKSAAEYGAFPTDPYSHTPRHGGAKQPGMTGQVKEEILTRLGELGVVVDDGEVSFRPTILRREELLAEPGVFRFHDLAGEPRTLDLPAGSLAFTFCQVPVTYERTDGEAWIRVTASGERPIIEPGDSLGRAHSRAVFERRGTVIRIDVGVPAARLVGERPTQPGPEREIPAPLAAEPGSSRASGAR